MGTPRREAFGRMPDGREIAAWHMREGALQATVLEYGARLAVLRFHGRPVVLELPDWPSWLADTTHLNAIAGRTAGRIAGGRFTLDGRQVVLAQNSHGHNLHGGPHGFGLSAWQGAAEGGAVAMTLVSPDGDQAFPGRLTATVRYAIEGDALRLDFAAEADAPTVVNLTNHAYFNLDGSPTIHGHVLTLHADRFLPLGPGSIPTGERRPVAGTVFDFRTPTAVGARIDGDDPQLQLTGGYDHCYLLADAPHALAPAALVEAGGVVLEVLTTEPAVQFYAGNNLRGAPHARRSALCLETQHYPDSPNHPDFPSITLRPGQVRRATTVFRLKR